MSAAPRARARRAGRSAGEAGFTLAEMILVIVILGVIFVTLTASVMLGLKTTRSLDVRTEESVAAEFTALHFTRDVQAATQVTVDDATASCGGPALVKLVSSTPDRVVAYALEPVGGGVVALVRRLCEPSGGGAQEKTLVPAATGATATCRPSADDCRSVALQVAQAGADEIVGFPFELVATRRPT